ncbi:DUF7848 domain-containing protein [Streptomyces luteogriseus]
MSCGSLTAEGPVCRGRQTTTMTATAAGMTARERTGPRCRQGVRMREDNESMRRRYRFAEWALRVAPNMAVRHFGKCLTCGQRCTDTAEPDEAQVWCLKHAGLTHHSGYELSAFQYFNATMVDPEFAGTRHGPRPDNTKRGSDCSPGE